MLKKHVQHTGQASDVGMIAAMQPRSDGFPGGGYTPAGRPTAVGGALGDLGTSYAVIHNETFSGVGITEDTVAPLWSDLLAGVLAGAVLFAVCGVCVVLFCSSFRQRTAAQLAYEGLPLITVKTMQR